MDDVGTGNQPRAQELHAKSKKQKATAAKTIHNQAQTFTQPLLLQPKLSPFLCSSCQSVMFGPPAVPEDAPKRGTAKACHLEEADFASGLRRPRHTMVPNSSGRNAFHISLDLVVLQLASITHICRRSLQSHPNASLSHRAKLPVKFVQLQPPLLFSQPLPTITLCS